MASANVSRSHPRSALSGSVKRPKLVRVPNVISAIAQPATITTEVVRQVAFIGRASYHKQFNH